MPQGLASTHLMVILALLTPGGENVSLALGDATHEQLLRLGVRVQ